MLEAELGFFYQNWVEDCLRTYEGDSSAKKFLYDLWLQLDVDREALDQECDRLDERRRD